MFASSERLRPWIARASCVSFARVTVKVPSDRSIFTNAWNVRVSAPFGPFTETDWPSTFTSTPLGSVIGSLPMRLIPSSPHVRQDLAAAGLLLGLAAGHEPRRGRHDRDAETAEDPWHLGLAGVDPQARPADAPDARDRGGLAADVLQLHHELRAGREHFALLRGLPLARGFGRVSGDEALGLQDPGDLDLDPARRDHHVLVAGAGGVADPREHVAHRIVDRDAARAPRLGHDDPARTWGLAVGAIGPLRGRWLGGCRCGFCRHLCSYQLDFVTPGSSPTSARSRKQIRHRPNLRMYPRGRPQTWQRW